MTDPTRDPRLIARRLLALVAAVVGAVAMIALPLIRFLSPSATAPAPPSLPPAFLVSTAALTLTSLFLERAVWKARRERQREFRFALAAALASAVLFAGAQIGALSSLKVSPDPDDEVAGVNTFLFVFAALHAVHVSVGIVLLSYTRVQAGLDRYDHEYHWGVRCCAVYWHFLGVVWLVILGVFGLAAAFLHP